MLDPDASADAGRTVTLTTARTEIGPGEASALAVPPGSYVELAVGCRATVFATTAAFRLARRNGGALVLEPDLVRLLLPVAGDAAPRADAADRRSVVLVVDDTEALRELTARALQRHGYAVLEAASGAEALRLVDQNQVDLVLTDVVMPRMSGLELHDAIAELPAPPPVLFMSGYSDSVLPEGTDVLRKPFSEQDLLDHVRGARRAGS